MHTTSLHQLINGRYQLNQKLGQGGMGIVHLATDRLTGEIVALKQVFMPIEQLLFNSRPTSQTNRALRLALAHEFQTLAGLRHPNIISVLDYGFDEKQQPFFTMSYLENAQTIVAAANGRSVPEKVDLLIQTLEALAYLHRRGILHRDLKPDNVLVVGDTVRVLDFGLAAAKEQATESVGSWLYMAPEVLLGQPATEASDLYAVGVLAYRLLAGTHPFDMYAEDTIDEILTGEPDWGKVAIEGELTAVIRTLLAKKPRERYATANGTIAAFYQALGQAMPEETAVIRESYLQAATFVGREAEMAQLTEAVHKAKASQGSSWLIGGESGVGKSRLINELRTHALVNGFLVLNSQSVTDKGGMPYQLWQEPLRHLLLTTPSLEAVSIGILAPLVPDIAQLTQQPIPPVAELTGQAAQQRLYQTIARLFQKQTQPVLLLLEDMQWAEESLGILAALTQVVSGQRLVIIGTYRDDERPNLPLLLPQMTLLPLRRLSANAMKELSWSMLGETGNQPEVLALLQQETEGNAFFAVEVIRTLAHRAGRLAEIGRHALPQKVWPQGIQTLVQQRLNRLPATDHALLRLVSVAGRVLDRQLVEALAHGATPDWVDAWILRCHEATILDVQNGRWQFNHDKIRDGIMSLLSPAQLVDAHRHIAQTLETVYTPETRPSARLAYHWGEAGVREAQARYALLAGKEAAQQFANQEAIHFYTLALEMSGSAEQQIDSLFAREMVYDRVGQRVEQAADLAALEGLITAVNQPDLQRQLLLRHVIYSYTISDFAKAIELEQKLIQEAEAAHDLPKLMAAHTYYGLTLRDTSNNKAASDHLNLALTLSRQLQDQHAENDILIRLGLQSLISGNYALAQQYYEESLALALARQDINAQAKSLNNLGLLAYEMGDFAKARQYYQESLHLTQKVGDRFMEGRIRNNLGLIAYELGQYSQALAAIEESIRINHEVGDRFMEAGGLSNLGLLYTQVGLYTQAIEAYHRSLAIAQTTGDRISEAGGLSSLGIAMLGQGDIEQAEIYCQAGLTIGRELEYPQLEASVWVERARVAQARQSWEEALAFYTQGYTIWQSLNNVGQALGPKAGIALCLWHLEQGELAQTYALPVAEYILQHSLTGYWNPMAAALAVYYVLKEVDADKAQAVVYRAYDSLQNQAAQIADPHMRDAFLNCVEEHRVFGQLYEMLKMAEVS
ncbi:MAG: tetratricopeptide repeat protein [Chloroflexota bacterium]